MPQRVRPLKIESPAQGGGQLDDGPTETNVGEDYLDAAGVCLQQLGANTQTADAKVFIDRATDTSLQLTDGPCGTLKLNELVTSTLGKPGTHAAVPDFMHWAGAPAEGHASGAFRGVTTTGVLPKTVTWYASSAATVRLYSRDFTYAGVLVTRIVHTLFQNNVAIRTMTEAFSYTASLFAPTITRTWQ